MIKAYPNLEFETLIFQFHQLLPEFIRKVCIPAFIANKPKQETEAEAKKLLDFLGLSHRLNHKPNALSGNSESQWHVR
jgi:lipoprotein-releasing system ATP-binding protein